MKLTEKQFKTRSQHLSSKVREPTRKALYLNKVKDWRVVDCIKKTGISEPTFHRHAHSPIWEGKCPRCKGSGKL